MGMIAQPYFQCDLHNGAPTITLVGDMAGADPFAEVQRVKTPAFILFEQRMKDPLGATVVCDHGVRDPRACYVCTPRT